MDVIAHYKLNDNAASPTVVDDTGVHNGNYKNNTLGNIDTDVGASTGKLNGALDFGSFDDEEYVEIADHADFTPILTPFSISAWCYMHSATEFIIASKGVYNTDGEWRFATETNDKLYAILMDESEADCYIGRIYTTALSVNTWYHTVMTYDGGATSDSIKLYLDGAKVDNDYNQNQQGNFVKVSAEGHAVWIARDADTYTDGLIDNVIFFSKELNIDDVKILFSAGHGTEIVADLDESRRIKRRPIWQR